MTKTLDLANRALEADDIDALAWVLKRNWPVRHMVLRQANIDDSGLHSLLTGMRLNMVLTTLDLRRTLVTDNGVRTLFEVMSNPRLPLRLTALDLRQNKKLTIGTPPPPPPPPPPH